MELRYLAKALTDHLLPTTLVDASVDAPTKRLVTTMPMQSWIMTMALAFPLQMANVTATATWKTLSACAEVHVQLTLTQMAFATTLTTAWVPTISVGVCNGDDTSCAGCDGVPGSGLEFDDCGVCGGDNSSCTGCLDETACNYDADATIQDYVMGSMGSLQIEFELRSILR